MYRTHTLDQIDESMIDMEVIVAGWVNSIRDHGGIIFVDLRDRYGFLQIKADPSLIDEKLMKKFNELKDEYVISVKGKIVLRPSGTENLKIKSGKVELLPYELNILSTSDILPFEVNKETPVGEEIRFKYRYLDLRRQRMKQNLEKRSQVLHYIYNFFINNKFLYVETPYLIKNTPEGAREFIVPSRFFRGKFYVLPQSPQQLKQILMVSGIDRYFQIARCFRDEDLRGDRQPEFTQIDIEMSFINSEDIKNLIENLLIGINSLYNKNIKYIPFKRLTWQQAIDLYGTDKPNLLIEKTLIDLTLELKGSINIFNVENIKGLLVDHLVSKSEIERLTKDVIQRGAKGLAYILFDGEPKSPIIKFLTNEIQERLYNKILNGNYNLQDAIKLLNGKTLFIQAGDWYLNCTILGYLRNYFYKSNEDLAYVWIEDFPMFEYDEELGAMHHPFTKPKDEYVPFIKQLANEIINSGLKVSDYFRKNPDILKNLLNVKAEAYDIVLNGYEIGGGSIRITDPELQRAIFVILGLNENQINERFGHLLKAFKYGVPPHGGIALGFDRLMMILQNEENIREVIAFPKTQKGEDLLLGAPSYVDEKILKELGIKYE